MKRLFLITFLLATTSTALAAPPAPASSAAPSERLGRMSDAQASAETDPPWLRKTVHDLVARGDADSLLTAALMTYDPSQRAQYAQAAALVAPKDADLAWLHWQFCDTAAHCDTDAALAWLQALEPGNAAVWLPNVASAEQSQDPKALDAALQRMADAPHFDIHAFRLAQRAMQVRGTAPFPPKLSSQHHDDYLVDFFERSTRSMQLQGPFQRAITSLALVCIDPHVSGPRAQACVRVGASMENSGALIAMLAGAAMIVHNSDNAAVRAAAKQRLHAVVWRVTHLPELARDSYDDSALARAWLAALRTQRSEDAALITLLQYRHIPIQPPSDWRPPPPSRGQ